MPHLGTTAARLKLKGIDGDPHKRWSMWFNSTQREEPYQHLTYNELVRDDLVPLRWNVDTGGREVKADRPFGEPEQVLHGCRQLVP